MAYVSQWEDSHFAEQYGYVHKDDLPDLDHAQDMVKGLMEAFYGNKNPEQFAHCLEELFHCFGIELKEYQMEPDLFTEFAHLTRQYLHNLNRRKVL